jgi:hypothetical protein
VGVPLSVEISYGPSAPLIKFSQFVQRLIKRDQLRRPLIRQCGDVIEGNLSRPATSQPLTTLSACLGRAQTHGAPLFAKRKSGPHLIASPILVWRRNRSQLNKGFRSPQKTLAGMVVLAKVRRVKRWRRE